MHFLQPHRLPRRPEPPRPRRRVGHHDREVAGRRPSRSATRRQGDAGRSGSDQPSWATPTADRGRVTGSTPRSVPCGHGRARAVSKKVSDAVDINPSVGIDLQGGTPAASPGRTCSATVARAAPGSASASRFSTPTRADRQPRASSTPPSRTSTSGDAGRTMLRSARRQHLRPRRGQRAGAVAHRHWDRHRRRRDPPIAPAAGSCSRWRPACA
jgi:hypothetical protein